MRIGVEEAIDENLLEVSSEEFLSEGGTIEIDQHRT